MSRRWKIFIAVAAVTLAIMVLIPVVRHYQLRTPADAYIAWLKARGEPMDLAQVLPPPVPPEQNGADIVESAFHLLGSPEYDTTNEPDAMFMVAPAKAVISFEQPDVRDRYFTNSWPIVMATTEANRPATELLRQVLNYPALDFHLHYGPDMGMQFTNFGSLRDCARKLSAEAICDLRNGDAPSAATDIDVILALINGVADERAYFFQYDREGMTTMAACASWQFLQFTNLSETDLAILQKSWERLEYLHAVKNAFLTSRVISELTIKKMRDSEAFFDQEIGDSGGSDTWDFAGDLGDTLNGIQTGVIRGYVQSMWHVSWTYSDELQMLKDYQLILETLPVIETNGYYNPAYSNLTARLDALSKSQDSGHLVYLHWMFSKDVEVTGQLLLGQTMMAEAAKRTVVTAIALKRYQLKHGSYPSDINALVPEFVSAVPMDPVDGKPLRYRRNPDGTFLLYSIGLDGKDDGGNASTSNHSPYYYWLSRRSLDWVWPQPATEKEIEDYYAHPPK